MKRPRNASKAKGRGPVEIIKGKTSSIPIYDAGGGRFIAAYYAEGKRRMVKYKSLEAAKAGAKEIIQTLTSGVAHVAAFTPKETASINEAVAILTPLEISLSNAVRQFAEAHKILRGGSIVSAAQFYAKHLEEENRRKQWTPHPNSLHPLEQRLQPRPDRGHHATCPNSGRRSEPTTPARKGRQDRRRSQGLSGIPHGICGGLFSRRGCDPDASSEDLPDS